MKVNKVNDELIEIPKINFKPRGVKENDIVYIKYECSDMEMENIPINKLCSIIHICEGGIALIEKQCGFETSKELVYTKDLVLFKPTKDCFF